MFKALTIGAAAVALLATPAKADDYFDGKAVKVIVNLSAGGSTGVMAQLFSRYWHKHLPGHPDFVVQPVTGGAQTKGIVTARTARPDGLTVAWVAWSGATRAIGPESQRIDWTQFDVIAGVGVPSLAYMRKDVPPGLSKPEDIAKADGVHIGGYRAGSYLDLTARMSLDLLGVKYKYTTGFKGGSNIEAALQRNEVNLHVTPAANYFGRTKANVVDTGTALALWWYPITGMAADKTFDGVETFADVAKKITGKAPSGPLWDSLVWLNDGMAGVTWFVGVPAGVDKKVLAQLRSSFDAAAKDPEFIAEAKKITGISPSFTGPAAMDKIVAQLKNVDPTIAKTVQGYIASGSAK